MSSQVYEERLEPPKPFFIGDDSRIEAEQDNTVISLPTVPTIEVPPSPCASVEFNPANPFTPPASVLSFSSLSRPGTADYSPVHTPAIFITSSSSSNTKHFPEMHTRNGSTVSTELPRSWSSFGTNTSQAGSSSRPGTGRTRSSSSARFREAFHAPPSRPMTALSTALPATKIRGERMRSTILSPNTPIPKPWLDEKRDPFSRIAYFLTYGVMFLGFVCGVLRCFFAWKDVRLMTDNLCLVMEDNFDGSELSKNWMREVQMDGFGNGEFAMTTSSKTNSFLRDGNLYITPTLTSDIIGVDAIYDGYTFNLTDCTYNQTRNVYPTPNSSNKPGSPSSMADHNGAEVADLQAYYRACGAVSNSTRGVVISPVQSARLTTRKSASIRYGKVEVRAKLPSGDWLWPAIWMLPVQNTYGPWPMSGEIDLMESRGNWRTYPKQGQNYVRGSIHWGPLSFLNQVYKTSGTWGERRGSYANKFHTYTLEWTEEFMRIYVDTRLHYMLDLRFNIPFFQRGKFPPVVQNGSDYIVLPNPWKNGSVSAPFDQKFYLILNVAVGGTNGWFPDNTGNKPWLDGSLTAMRDFAKSQGQWYPTWSGNADDRSLVVDYVKMWERC